jgi:hypothetical protein
MDRQIVSAPDSEGKRASRLIVERKIKKLSSFIVFSHLLQGFIVLFTVPDRLPITFIVQ